MKKTQDFERLLGRRVSSWVGTELAVMQDIPIVWTDDSCGFLQFFDLEVQFSDNTRTIFTADLDDDGDYFGLYLNESALLLEVFDAHGPDFMRGRVATEIPTGCIEHVEIVNDSYGQVVIVSLMIGGREVKLSCGELGWEDGKITVERPQEFVLVELTDHRSQDAQSEPRHDNHYQPPCFDDFP